MIGDMDILAYLNYIEFIYTSRSCERKTKASSSEHQKAGRTPAEIWAEPSVVRQEMPRHQASFHKSDLKINRHIELLSIDIPTHHVACQRSHTFSPQSLCRPSKKPPRPNIRRRNSARASAQYHTIHKRPRNSTLRRTRQSRRRYVKQLQYQAIHEQDSSVVQIPKALANCL